MRPVTVTTTGVSVSPPVVLDNYQDPFNVGIGCTVTGTVTYTIQHTFDDVFAVGWDPSTANWFPHDDAALVAATANANSNFAYPCRAARINQTAGSGSVQAIFVQSGIRA